MAVANEGRALRRLATDPVSRRKLLAVGGGSTAMAAFLAACGSDDDDMTTTTASGGASGSGTEEFGKGDVGILNYALTLEYLEAAFYADVAKSGLFKGSDLETIRKFGSEEAEHVTALTGFVKQMGGTPASKPKTEFPLKSAGSVLELAATVENLGAAAYLGQAPYIKGRLGAFRGALDPQRRGSPRGGAQHPARQLDRPRRGVRQAGAGERSARVGRTLHRRLSRRQSERRTR